MATASPPCFALSVMTIWELGLTDQEGAWPYPAAHGRLSTVPFSLHTAQTNGCCPPREALLTVQPLPSISGVGRALSPSQNSPQHHDCPLCVQIPSTAGPGHLPSVPAAQHAAGHRGWPWLCKQPKTLVCGPARHPAVGEEGVSAWLAHSCSKLRARPALRGERCPRGRSTQGPPWITHLGLPHTTLNASREWEQRLMTASCHSVVVPLAGCCTGHVGGTRRPENRQQKPATDVSVCACACECTQINVRACGERVAHPLGSCSPCL